MGVSMKKSSVYPIVIGAIVLVAGVGWYVVAHRNNTSPNTMNMSSSSTNQNSVATSSVAIQNFAFSPANITVKKGTTVTWTNKDSVAHTVTETDGKTGPTSGDVNPGANYTFTFNTPGTYHYHCSIHPEMVGTVIVTS